MSYVTGKIYLIYNIAGQEALSDRKVEKKKLK